MFKQTPIQQVAEAVYAAIFLFAVMVEGLLFAIVSFAGAVLTYCAAYAITRVLMNIMNIKPRRAPRDKGGWAMGRLKTIGGFYGTIILGSVAVVVAWPIRQVLEWVLPAKARPLDQEQHLKNLIADVPDGKDLERERLWVEAAPMSDEKRELARLHLRAQAYRRLAPPTQEQAVCQAALMWAMVASRPSAEARDMEWAEQCLRDAALAYARSTGLVD